MTRTHPVAEAAAGSDTRLRNRLRWAALLAGGAALGIAIVLALVLLAAAAGGVLTTPPGAWVTRLAIAPGVAIRLSVPGLLRFATSPTALRLLDGRRFDTGIGRLRLARDGDALLAACAPCLVDASRWARQTIHIDRAELRLTRAGAQALAGELRSGDVRLPFTARLQPEHIDVEWRLPPTGIAALYRLLGSVIPEAHLAAIDGRARAHGSLRLPQLRAEVEAGLDGFAVAGLGTEALATDPIMLACRDAGGMPQPQRLTPGAGRWISPTQSGRLLAAAVIAADGQRDHEHPGFDSADIVRSLAPADTQGTGRGAGTITAQLARRLFTDAERTVAGTLRELLYRVEMERTLDKRQILALHLNTVQWGPGICGADAAARAYFGKRPHRLTTLEAAWLASILRDPSRAYLQQYLAAAPDTARAARVLGRMHALPAAERSHWARQALQFAVPPRGAPALAAAPTLAEASTAGRP